jgi:glyoxylase-like metal-dependent hydrolase (beta-lactamase superfamily II)
MIRALVAAVAVLASPTVGLADVLELQAVTDDVWAVVGPLEQRSPENLATNATFGLVVTPEGAVLIDPGGSWMGAEMLHAAVRGVTDLPVVCVINTGGQDHRWLGNGYGQAQDASVIASEAAVADHRARAEEQMIALTQFLGDGLDGTEPAYADVTFETDHRFEFGGFSFVIMHRGPAHTPGDSFVWLDERNVMFAAR